MEQKIDLRDKEAMERLKQQLRGQRNASNTPKDTSVSSNREPGTTGASVLDQVTT